MKIAVGIIAVVLLAAAVRQASAVFAPLALALFIIAIVWPLQSRLQARMPKLLALAITHRRHDRGLSRFRLARGLGLWPGRTIADRRCGALSGAL